MLFRSFRNKLCVMLSLLLVLQVPAGGLTALAGDDDDIPNQYSQVSIHNDGDNLPAVTMLGTSAILMEADSGQVVYDKDAKKRVSPASITKVMSLLIVMEALNTGRLEPDQMLKTSKHASSIGGSDIWLEPGEEMSVNDLLKATVVASANDAITVLAEAIAGSEEGFVVMMNDKAKALGMNDTHFVNCHGLDAENHYSTAYDIALMSREILKYPKVFEYTKIWTDTLRDGKTQLTNTNKLIRTYEGMTGLKTGTTGQAGSCLTATATRNNMTLVAVVMGAPNQTDRSKSVTTLLDYGFANFSTVVPGYDTTLITPVRVLRGTMKGVDVTLPKIERMLIQKGKETDISVEIEMSPDVEAPVEKGQVLGHVNVLFGGEKYKSYPVKAANPVGRMTFQVAFGMLFRCLIRM